MRDDLVGAVRDAVAAAREAGRDVLLENEGLAVVEALGIETPPYMVVPRGGPVTELARLRGERLVVKTLSATILHKTDVGAVRIVPRSEVADVLAELEDRFGDETLEGFLVAEFVEHDIVPGAELLIGMRRTEDFGPVVTLGLGGVHAEALASHLSSGQDVAVLSPSLAADAQVTRALRGVAAVDLVSTPQREQPPRLAPEDLRELLARWTDFALIAAAEGLSEFEVNPLVVRDGKVIALDALGRIEDSAVEATPPRPLERIHALLCPESMAIVGVSRRSNPGRIILENVLAAGFPRDNVRVIKQGVDEILGCRCVASMEELDAPVDVLVVSVAAGQAADVVSAAVRGNVARSVILIPGGFGEHAEGAAHASRVRDAITESRARADGGVVVNGGNCLGIRSVPGRYNTLFIPPHKLSFEGGRPAPLAVLSQSGAFAVAWASRLGRLDPRYLVTMGNQVDLTVADYLEHLAEDPEVRVFACYVEGFRAGDGLRFARVAAQLADEGRPVVLYRAGRTSEGAQASASHTASIAGDYAVCRSIAESAGVLVTNELADFNAVTRMFCQLDGKRVEGMRLGAVSNAGYETVAVADHASAFTFPALSEGTAQRVTAELRNARLESIVSVRNPLDVTPILDDAGFDECARAILDDPRVDVGLIGCVPLSGAITTLPAADGHTEDIAAETSLPRRLAALHRSCEKAWVATVDAGRAYDPMAYALSDAGIPTFRNTDRALRLFGRFCAWRRAHPNRTA